MFEQTEANTRFEKPRVLMVDDDWVSRKLVSHSLKANGFEVLCLEDSLNALETARDWRPDLILLDLMMPMKSGYATLLEFKADPGLEAIPVIIMSAKSQEDEMASCREGGAADYLVKPVGFKDLRRRIRQILDPKFPTG